MPSADPLLVYDGFTATPLGVSGADHPLDTPEGALYRLVNGTVRSGRPRTRPGFPEFPLTFPTARYAELFATGKFQGSFSYDSDKGAHVVFAVSGHVFRFDPGTGNVEAISDQVGRMDPNVARLYFLFTGRYLVVQDGKSRPLIFDGSSARRSSFADQEIPVGTFMAYGHGRIFVTVPGTSTFVAGDFELPNDPASALTFTETEYLNGGGAFALPMALGRITGMAFLRATATSNSLGLLAVSGETGISYFNVAFPRSTWTDVNISAVGVLGNGVAAHDTLVNVGDDLLYLSNDGDIRTIKSSQAASGVQIHRSYSREVSHWLRDNTGHLLPYGSAMLHNRRVYFTVAAEWTPSLVDREEVQDVRHKGMIALDYDRAGGVASSDRPAFDGLWTGLRPVGMASCQSLNRAFIFSRDSDGRTRAYEVVEDSFDAGGALPVMQVQPGAFVFVGKDRKLVFTSKNFDAVEVWIENVLGPTRASYALSADSGPWVFGDYVEFSPALTEGATGPKNHRPGSWSHRTIPSPSRGGCHPGDNSMAQFGYRFDVRLFVEGRAEIVLFRARAQQAVDEAASKPACCALSADFDLAPIDDYGYDARKARK